MSIDSTNPSQLFGGTWETFAQGKTLVGVDTSQEEFDTVLKTGGAKTHTLTVAQMPSHSHLIAQGSAWGTSSTHTGLLSEMGSTLFRYPSTDNRGGNQPHNNLQPYITVYMWYRVS